MISVYKIKPAFQKLLQPLLKALHKGGVTANQLTVFAILFSAGLGVLFYFHQKFPYFLLLVALGLLLRMVFNALDGMMARQFNMQSKLGEVLNEIGDVVSDCFIFIPLVVIPGVSALIIIGFVVLAIINEMAGVVAKVVGGERRYDGPMGKSDRAFLVGLYCIIAYFWPDLHNYADYVFGGASVLIILSTTIRLRKALK